jgi:phosphoserine phosphatase
LGLETKISACANIANMSEIKAVILDLDQTITSDVGSWSQFTQLLGADLSTHLKIYSEFKSGNLSYQAAKQQLILLWKSAATLDRISIENLFEKIELRDGVLDAVDYLKGKYKLCIISGAIDIFVDAISSKVGIVDKYAATKFIFDDNNVLTDFDYKLSRGEEKVGFLHQFCSKYHLKVLECAAVGDGESDMPIFDEVSLPLLFIASETTEEQKRLIQRHLYEWKDVYKYL